MKPTYFNAVQALVGGGIFGPTNGTLQDYDFQDGQTPPTEEAINAKLAELVADYESKAYQRNRQYPSIENQLDMIYWDKINGTETWKESIDKVKADNPKPE